MTHAKLCQVEDMYKFAHNYVDPLMNCYTPAKHSLVIHNTADNCKWVRRVCDRHFEALQQSITGNNVKVSHIGGRTVIVKNRSGLELRVRFRKHRL